jgi:hypothetical protein
VEHENTDAQVRELLTVSDRQGRTVDYGVYSKMMRKSFEHIRQLRAEKFKFSDICGAYAKAGALPSGADPSSFRKAFRNEEKRRAKNLELEKRVADGRGAPVGNEAAAGRIQVKKTPVLSAPAKPEQKRPEAAPVRSETEQERIKRLISPSNIGVGGTVRNPDGSFDVL